MLKRITKHLWIDLSSIAFTIPVDKGVQVYMRGGRNEHVYLTDDLADILDKHLVEYLK